MYILYLITSGCRWKMYDPSTPLGSCFQFSSLSCFSHPWLNKTNAYAFCSSFGYRYYSTRCWLVRHQLLTTNRWNKILRIHSGYDLSSGAVCRFCDSFLDSGHKKNRASLHPFVKGCTALYLFKQKNRDNHPRQKGPNSVEENICEQKLQDLKPGPQWEFHTVVKEGPDRRDLTRSLYKNLLTASLANFHTSTF